MMRETVADVAKTIRHPVEALIKKFAEAGCPGKSPDDFVSEKEKRRLFEHLTGRSGSDSGRKKVVSEIKTKGRVANTINVVEIRRRKLRPKPPVKEKEAPQQKTKSDGDGEGEAPSAAEKKKTKRIVKPVKKDGPAKDDSTGKKDTAEKKTRKGARPAAAKSDAKEQKKEPEAKKKAGKKTKAQPPARTGAKKQQQGRQQLHLADNLSAKRKIKRRFPYTPVIQPARHEFEKPTKTVVREVEVPETISVAKLAQRLAVKGTRLVQEMMTMKIMATINQILDQDTAALIVEELGHRARLVKTNIEDSLLEETKPQGELSIRPPVVTVMGHVDHGKTSLLDHIRRSQVARHEAGGITQHIGAYLVRSDEGGHRGAICFLDTPGHAAFTSMRARGAQLTDIIVLVVAADDSVMPQTKEAIEHAKAAGVPIVVAINKIDKEGANAEKVKTDLSQLGVLSEDWGGHNIMVEVSAKTGQGISQLLEFILIQAEMMELKAVKTGPASGIVIESRLDRGRGPVVNVLVLQGCLYPGDIVLAGSEYGRARVILDEHGETLKRATPATPVSLLGLSGAAEVGEKFLVVADEKKARATAVFRRHRAREAKLARKDSPVENIFSAFGEKEPVAVNVLIKSDSQGSAEALRDAVGRLSSDDIGIKIVSCGVGAISESDIRLAGAANASVYGFNVRADGKARKAVQLESVPLHYYSVIYELVEEIKRVMQGAAEPHAREIIVGLAVVKDVFHSSRLGAVAGCEVAEGVIKRGCPIRVLRDDVVIYEGQLESLRRYKDDVSEVAFGSECGIAVKNYNDVKVGDSIEVYEQLEVEKRA